MNYYRRYCGDYAADTPHLSMLEHGAYTLLLDAYYTMEKPLPDSMDMLYRICRAQTPAEKRAVLSVATQFFPTDGEFRRNARADKELAIAVPKMDAMRERARSNGRKNKPKQAPTSDAISEPTSPPTSDRHCGQPPTASHQPPDSKPPSEERFPGRDTTPGTAALGAAALRKLHPPGPEADVRTADETPAGMLAAVCQRNGIQAHAFHPLIVEWAREGRTVEQIKAAIATARQPQRKGDGQIPLAYLDRILGDDNKPKPVPWKTDDAEARKLCAQLGIKPDKVGESRDAWHRRIETALAEQSRSRVA